MSKAGMGMPVDLDTGRDLVWAVAANPNQIVKLSTVILNRVDGPYPLPGEPVAIDGGGNERPPSADFVAVAIRAPQAAAQAQILAFAGGNIANPNPARIVLPLGADPVKLKVVFANGIDYAVVAVKGSLKNQVLIYALPGGRLVSSLSLGNYEPIDFSVAAVGALSSAEDAECLCPDTPNSAGSCDCPEGDAQSGMINLIVRCVGACP
jgi:hypothetical protein